MQPYISEIIRSSAYCYSSLSALKPMLSMLGAFLTDWAKSASQTSHTLISAIELGNDISLLVIVWDRNAYAIKISSFSSAIATTLFSCLSIPLTLIARVYNSAYSFVYLSAL
jgi:hypothetical protein